MSGATDPDLFTTIAGNCTAATGTRLPGSQDRGTRNGLTRRERALCVMGMGPAEEPGDVLRIVGYTTHGEAWCRGVPQ